MPAVTAATFTTSMVQAAPVVLSKSQLEKSNLCRAIIINSGNANACTGNRGMKDAISMINNTAWVLDVYDHEVLVASTGVIGQFMPIENILPGIKKGADELRKSGSLRCS